MYDFDAAPMLRQVFSNQAAVALVGFFFAAKQAGAVNSIPRNIHLNLARLHQFNKLPFVLAPLAFVFLVGVKQILCRRKQRLVNVIHFADFAEKKFQVALLRESSQLRNIVEPDIHNSLCARIAEYRKKSFSGFFGEPYSEDFHAEAFSLAGSLA